MIFIPSLSMLEYLDKFGKTVSVVEWIVYLNNSLLASQTSLFPTVWEMTDCSHLPGNTAGVWGLSMHPPFRTAKAGQPLPPCRGFQLGLLFYKLGWKMVHMCWERIFVCCSNEWIYFIWQEDTTGQWHDILFQCSKWEVLYQPSFKAGF